MRKGFVVTSIVLAVLAVAAWMIALANIGKDVGETCSDIGNATMITAVFLSVSALHVRRPEGA